MSFHRKVKNWKQVKGQKILEIALLVEYTVLVSELEKKLRVRWVWGINWNGFRGFIASQLCVAGVFFFF